MNKVILRFKVIKNKQVFEVMFDTRLSFIDNFKMLNDIFEIPKYKYIIDEINNVSLKQDIPISLFNLSNLITLSLY